MPELRTFSACVTRYFKPDLVNLDGRPDPRWTIGVMDHPEIATTVTDQTGCAEIALPDPSDLIVTATKPTWVPNALTVRVRDGDVPSMNAQNLQAFAGLYSWWWDASQSFQPSAATVESTGFVAAFLFDRSTWVANREKDLKNAFVAIPNIEPILYSGSEEPRTDWAYVAPFNPSYCNLSNDPNANCAPTGYSGMNYVSARYAEIEFPGVTCPIGENESALAWPIEGKTNRFSMDVRPGYVTWVIAFCELAR